MKCKNCGYEIEPGKFVCPQCVTPVQIVPDFNEFDESLNELVGEEDAVHLNEPEEEKSLQQTKNRKEKPRKKSHKLLMISGLLVILIISAALAGLYAYQLYREKNFSVDYQLQHARAAVKEHDAASAIAFYSKAMELSAESRDIIREFADYYKWQGEKKEAASLYRKLLSMEPKNLEIFTILFEMYEEEGDLDTILAFRTEACTPEQNELFLPYGISNPTFSIAGGDFADFKVIEIFADPGMDIYYVINGNDPCEQGTLYNDPIELNEEGTFIISAACKNDRNMFSNVVSEIYTINIPAPESPSLTPDGGDFVYSTTVFVSIPENCIAYYTLDGSQPTDKSKQVSGVISIPEGNHVLSVIAIDERTGKMSDVYRARYTYYPQAEEPEVPEDNPEPYMAAEEEQ